MRPNHSVPKTRSHSTGFSISAQSSGRETARVDAGAIGDQRKDYKAMNDYSLFYRCRSQHFALVLVALTSVSTAFAEEIQVGRYATVRAVPTLAQVNLLSAPVRVQFPESVVTVGQAVEYLLQSSGYRLAPEAVAEPFRAVLLVLPLPEPHRTLGPMPLQIALETLAGPAYRLVEDPVHRLVTFERCGPIEPGPSATPSFEAR